MPERLSAILATAPLPEVVEMVNRLASLPEFGMGYDVAAIRRMARDIREREEVLAEMRRLLRDRAAQLLGKCAAQWSPAEIEKQTGYQP